MESLISIEPKRMRVEFEGQYGPTHVVVPLILRPGKHRNVQIRVCPRPGIALRNEVTLGDALQATFPRSHSTSMGGSFFATASHSRTFGHTEKTYEVVSLPDFRGVLFRLNRYDLEDEPIGLQLAFPIASYEPHTNTDYFAEVSLEIDKLVLERFRVPREVHPKAGKVLVLSGYSEELFENVSGYYPLIQNTRLISPFLEMTECRFFRLHELPSLLTSGFQGIHLYTNVIGDSILVDDKHVPASDFFSQINGFGLKFIYIDTCNSVWVVSSFRKTDISALIAATENLEVNYANEFESRFYQELGAGAFISRAFQCASSVVGTMSAIGHRMRSGVYDPMFLDLRADFRFGQEGK